MPTTQFRLLTTTRIPPGETRQPIDTDVGAKRYFRIRLDPNMTDFADESWKMQIDISLSRNAGADWTHIKTVMLSAGPSRSKDGQLPYAAISMPDGGLTPFPAGTLARLTYRHNANSRMGLIGELED